MVVKKLRYSTVPDAIDRQFTKAEQLIERFFANFKSTPEQGEIRISDERYILIRSEGFVVDALRCLSELVGRDRAQRMLYNFAKSIGMSDADAFCKRYQMEDILSCFAIGPIHFAFAGYGSVIIYEESNIAPDESFFIIYDHPNTFESEIYLRKHIKTDEPVCFFSAGYSAGWCEECFGIRLESLEIACRAKGDPYCRFIMAPPSKLPQYLEEYFPDVSENTEGEEG